MNPLFIVRGLLRRVLHQYMALSADNRRFAVLMLLWVLAMLASMAAGQM
ncbi:MAG: hypothetical protein V4679_05995 [Pseudomonadota bacterium]